MINSSFFWIDISGYAMMKPMWVINKFNICSFSGAVNTASKDLQFVPSSSKSLKFKHLLLE